MSVPRPEPVPEPPAGAGPVAPRVPAGLDPLVVTREDACQLALAIVDASPPAALWLVGLRPDGGLCCGASLVRDDDLEGALDRALPQLAGRFLLVSDRTAGATVRFGDVLRWEEVAGAFAATGAAVLDDWIVVDVWGARSIAPCAPTPGLPGPA